MQVSYGGGRDRTRRPDAGEARRLAAADPAMLPGTESAYFRITIFLFEM